MCPSSALRSVTGLLDKMLVGTVAWIAVGCLTMIGQATEVSPALANHSATETLTAANSATARSLPDRIYLYSQSLQPNPIGAAYMVLQVKDRQVAGAF